MQRNLKVQKIQSIWRLNWRAIRRRESVSSFILTIGLVDLALGSVSQQSALISVGLAIVGIAAVLRWRQAARRISLPNDAVAVELPPQRYLTGRPDRPLPQLSLTDRPD